MPGEKRLRGKKEKASIVFLRRDFMLTIMVNLSYKSWIDDGVDALAR